jgi:hypothetical protein
MLNLASGASPSRPSPRTSQQSPCHAIYLDISISYADDRETLTAGSAGLAADFAERPRLVAVKFAVF